MSNYLQNASIFAHDDDFNLTNSTNETEVPILKVVHDVLVITLMLSVMFAMGCIITLGELLDHLKRPVGVCIGMASQFVLLPLATFCLILSLRIDSMHGTGMLLVSCSPGGVTSNVFTYFSLGNVPLSVTMTSCSTLLAMGMMPLNIWIYGRYLEKGNIIIPYGKIGMSLVSVTAPVAAGMLLKSRYPRVAHYCSRVGTYAGITIILLTQVMETLIFPNIFRRIHWTLYIAVVVLPFFSLFLGYGLAWICRQSSRTCRTVAIECSIQNLGISLTVVAISFPFEMQQDVIAFSYLYPLPMISTATVAVLIYRLVKKFRGRKDKLPINGAHVAVTEDKENCCQDLATPV